MASEVRWSLSLVRAQCQVTANSSVVFQDNGTKGLEKLSDELRKVQKSLTLLVDVGRDEEKAGYWTRVAIRINKVFFLFYVTMIGMFLVFMFIIWINAQE